ncbi:MAG: response regulator transcription factor [Rubripirellula sp.]
MNPPATKTIRVMLVEDNRDYRSVVELALSEESDIELISQFGTSEIAIRSLSAADEIDIPDVILLDIRLPGMDGLDAIREFRRSAPNMKILILTQSSQEEDVLRAISLGAAGYLLKSTTLKEITDSIRTVAGGGASLVAGIAKFILHTLKTIQTGGGEGDESRLLSDRELQILSLLAEGLVKKEIAKELSISYATVDTHVGRIYQKLDVSNAPSAVNRAHRMRLFPPDA